MSTANRWEILKFISKIEIVPGPGGKDVRAELIEDFDYEYQFGSYSSSPVITKANRRIRLGNEVLRFHYDYPEEFKKLTKHFKGDKSKAYHAYMALQTKVEEDWDS